jgi:hypothetical protein
VLKRGKRGLKNLIREDLFPGPDWWLKVFVHFSQNHRPFFVHIAQNAKKDSQMWKKPQKSLYLCKKKN